ncbi:hypothetical protein [Rhizobium leguminosarum]|uniref:hypothetical protein n=1 Tax=Rhizobium leguminosarum TaxID=384 RepID=UPI00160BDE95|nr:hypothetical protein [Rhizobium leguminosarum]MBB4345200.1 hypothetical protein [Rhizobium leguminosarum]MBB6298271.1 hypothetical protein [Rhizobium leguminosarum]
MYNETQEANEKHAIIAHDRHTKELADTERLVESFGNAAMKAPAIASAGGIAGLLGFFSANAKVIANTEGNAVFSTAIIYFFISVLFAVIAPSVAYITQYLYTTYQSAHTLHYDYPFVRPKPSATYYRGVGYGFHLVTLALVFASIAFLIMGGLEFLRFAAIVGHAPLSPFLQGIPL